MPLKNRLAGLIAASLMLGGGAASAATINFAAHGVDFGNPIYESGFTFDVSAEGWGVAMNGDSVVPLNDNGSRDLFAIGGFPATITMTPTGGGTFGVSSLDAAVAMTAYGPGTLVLTGHQMGGGTVTTVLDTTATWTNFVLPASFTDLTALTFQDGASGAAFEGVPGLGLDNITLGSAVPEPSAWVLMIAGLAMIGFAARRQTADDALAA